MNPLKIIHWPAFILSFTIGFVYTMYLDPKHAVQVYPNPDNVERIQYKDSSNTVFEYKFNKVKCPRSDEITKYPIQ